MDGRMVMLALMGGTKIEKFDISKIVLNRLKIIGSTLRSRDINYQIDLKNKFWTHSQMLFESLKLKPVIDKVYNWHDVALAHEYMEDNENFGKIVLEIS